MTLIFSAILFSILIMLRIIKLNDFKDQKLQSEFKEYGWKIRNEQQFEYLQGQISLSKNGNAYLTNIDSLTQYWNMIMSYWEKINWDYFEPARNVYGVPLDKYYSTDQMDNFDLMLNVEYCFHCAKSFHER